MTLNDKELLDRDANRNVGEELLQAIRDIKSGKMGNTYSVQISPIAEARHKLDFSQAEFARVLGVPLRTLQEWEQGRRQPSGAAKSLIAIAIKRPDILKEILAA